MIINHGQVKLKLKFEFFKFHVQDVAPVLRVASLREAGELHTAFPLYTIFYLALSAGHSATLTFWLLRRTYSTYGPGAGRKPTIIIRIEPLFVIYLHSCYS